MIYVELLRCTVFSFYWFRMNITVNLFFSRLPQKSTNPDQVMLVHQLVSKDHLKISRDLVCIYRKKQFAVFHLLALLPALFHSVYVVFTSYAFSY